MAEPFVGQIIMTGFNFAPRGYATCDGQIIPIAQNTALFSLLGTTYGGNGQTTFGLPDFRGRLPLHQGQGPGLTPRTMGESAGSESVTLIQTQMPAHVHPMMAFQGQGDAPLPEGNLIAGSNQTGTSIFTNVAPNTAMSPMSVGTAGGSQPHQNMQPFLVISFSIALQGIFPSRN